MAQTDAIGETTGNADGEHPAWMAYAMLCASPLFFSSNLIIGKAASEAVMPSTLAFWRWLIAFAVMLPFAWPGLRRHWPQLRAHLGELLALGFLGMMLCGALIYLSLQSTTATNATLIYTSSPVMIVLLEWAFRGIRPKLRQIAGIVIAFVGVAVIILKAELARLVALDLNIGDLGVAVAALSWALYSVILRRKHLARLPTITLFAAIALAGTILLAPLMAWEAVAYDAVPRTAQAWWSILGVAIIASALAYSTFQYGIKVLGPSVAGVFMYLLPVYGIALAVLLLGEQVRAFHVAGFAWCRARRRVGDAASDTRQGRRAHLLIGAAVTGPVMQQGYSLA